VSPFKKVLSSEENIDILSGFITDFFGFISEEITIKNPYSVQVYKKTIKNKEASVLKYTLKVKPIISNRSKGAHDDVTASFFCFVRK